MNATITRQPDGVYVVRGAGIIFLVADKPRKLGMTDPKRTGWAFAPLGGLTFGWGHKTLAACLAEVERVMARDAKATVEAIDATMPTCDDLTIAAWVR